MNVKLLHQLPPAENNPRNSEGAFIRGKRGPGGRTPFVLRKSTDGGKTFGKLNIIEDDPNRGYSYPAMFQTNDGRLLLGYCRGDGITDGNNLCRLGIAEVEIASIE